MLSGGPSVFWCGVGLVAVVSHYLQCLLNYPSRIVSYMRLGAINSMEAETSGAETYENNIISYIYIVTDLILSSSQHVYMNNRQYKIIGARTQNK